MLYLIWTLVNIGLFVYFIFLCAQSARLLKEKTGFYASVIFVFGLVSLAVNSGRKTSIFKGNPDERTWKLVEKKEIIPNSIRFSEQAIDDNMLFSILLRVENGTEKTTAKTIPVEAHSFVIGSITGYQWEPTLISVNATNGANYAYRVIGILHWKLLGISLYSQPKMYAGIVGMK
ncbi:hypothetical protein [Larkinella rosea]|uniref:Uncharacterized protein n=1 Tax=Larkinella rosea TaxID=2025312 RepID=A0A3P1C365_9BACT|nr:hypothetical protein [Larkinella rosea]RRB07503.1 hypothetical protein EHT25_06905 [Larkinella rosea]